MPNVSTTCISQLLDNQGPRVIDSGASDHIYVNASLFSSLSSPKFPHLITLANGAKVASKGVGQISVSPSLNLEFVLFVLNCPFNLISLRQLTKSSNCSITFYVDLFVIHEHGKGQTIGVGHESRGLYYLETNSSVSCLAAPSPKLIHDRLGHPNMSKLKKMVPGLSKLQRLECESSQLGRHARSSFPKQTEPQCISPFSTIHLDIWGLTHVISFGFRYFVTFIDEHSRCTWVYLMKDRSEILSIFASSSMKSRTNLEKLLKFFEVIMPKNISLLPFLLSSFLSSQGILHQSTCLHTPQQNGLIERKSRHLVETARTLLLNANHPVHYWCFAVLIASFVINRIPSSTLDNKILFSIISPNEPLYHVSPCVFGCTCFVHDISMGLDKLPAKAIKCVFLGYSHLQKGYRCYSLDTKRLYMSTDVTFFEETPFFSSSMQDLQQVLPIPSFSPIVSPTYETPNQEGNQNHSPTESSSTQNHSPTKSPSPPVTSRQMSQGNDTLQDESLDSCSSPLVTPTTDPHDESLGWPIALRKGIQST